MRTEIENVEPLRTESVKAQEIRAAITPLLDDLCEIINQARREGLIVGFQIGMDQYGRSRPQDISIVKPL